MTFKFSKIAKTLDRRVRLLNRPSTTLSHLKAVEDRPMERLFRFSYRHVLRPSYPSGLVSMNHGLATGYSNPIAGHLRRIALRLPGLARRLGESSSRLNLPA